MSWRDEATVVLCALTSWRDPRDVLRDCLGCGRPFWVHPRHPQQRYCADPCRQRTFARSRGGLTEPPPARTLEAPR